MMIFEMSTLKTIKGTYHGEQDSSCSVELKESMSTFQILYNNSPINSYSLFRNLTHSDELQQRLVNRNISRLHTEALNIQNRNCLIISKDWREV